MSNYTIDSFKYFPCNTAREFFELRKGNLKVTTIKYIPIGVDLRYADYYILHTAIILFLN